MRRLLPIMLIAALVLAIVYGAYVRTHRKPGIEGPVMIVRFLGRKAGSAVVVRTPEKETIVIDPAPGAAVDTLLGDLRDVGVHSASVILSQPSEDSAKAVRQMMQSLKVTRLIRPELGSHRAKWQAALAGLSSVREIAVARNERLNLSPSVGMHVLNPARGDDGALVFRITYGDRSFLFSSGALGTEAELIRSGQDLSASVLVASQRGRYSGTSLELLSMVRPQIIVISGSTRPAASVLNRLSTQHTGAALYRTDRKETVRIDTDGRTFQISTTGGAS